MRLDLLQRFLLLWRSLEVLQQLDLLQTNHLLLLFCQRELQPESRFHGADVFDQIDYVHLAPEVFASLLKESLHPRPLHELAWTDVIEREEFAIDDLSEVIELVRIETGVEVGDDLVSFLECNLIPLGECLLVEDLELVRHKVVLESLEVEESHED